MYQRSVDGPLRQCEVVSDLTEYVLEIDEGGSPLLRPMMHSLAIVVSQDCDLEWDYKARFQEPNDPKLLRHVLLCEVAILDGMRSTKERRAIDSDIMKRVRQNEYPRYQSLQRVPQESDALGQGLPAIGIDFKKIFSVPTAVLYRQIDLRQVHRRFVLLSPYLEQVSTRCFDFLGRVALPNPHQID